MSDPTRAATERLPIKLIEPRQGTERRVKAGGGEKKPFIPVTDAVRSSLSTQVKAIADAIRPQIGITGAAPVRVQLRSKALAKSHRPTRLFNQRTCPIVGVGSHGELFVKATPEGLSQLDELITNGTSDQVVKDISTLTAIEAVTPQERRKKKAPLQILQASPKIGSNRFLTRVRLFDFGASQERLIADFEAACAQREIPFSRRGYGRHTQAYGVACRNEADIEALSRVVGVRSIIGMPILRNIRAKAVEKGAAPSGLPDPSQVEGDYPCVVVVDSGIDKSLPQLMKWVAGSETTVTPQTENTGHGTFVAGLIVWGERLNPNMAAIDSAPCGVFDLQVIPNDDPAFGDIEDLYESEFLYTLEQALIRHANKYKVWNLSLGTDEVCAEDEFSAFAEQLDDLQEKYQVSFVLAAGNCANPLMPYPRTAAHHAAGRITAPADSVLGVTVGAISHQAYNGNGPNIGELSPFSRHGSGPNSIIKPDLVHFGGTCSIDGHHQSGIRSITRAGVGEDLGTSFAAPLVSRSLAQIYHQITPTPSPVLARALLTHHARDPRTGGRVPVEDVNYLGFGRPVPPPYCLECEPHQSTLIFTDTLRPGFFLEWDDFPYPPSLKRGGKYYGDITMTIAFAPSRSGNWGTEYCETHIEAHFGVYRMVKGKKDANGERKLEPKFFGQVPPEHANPERLFEDVQIRELRKWAPVRTYHGDLSKGVLGDRWRLKLQLLTRHDDPEIQPRHAQPFALIVTISDPDKKVEVYDEMARQLRSRYQSENLTLRAAARIRANNQQP